MNQTERLHKIDQLLNERKVVPLRDFLRVLEVSPATFKRDLAYLRDRLHAPIAWDAEARGYRLAPADKHAPAYVLPGLWFNESEIHALLSMQHLLSNIDADILTRHIKPLQDRLKAVLGTADHSADEVARRVRIAQSAKRRTSLQHFAAVASATLARRQLAIQYFSRAAGDLSVRTVSPQVLTHYRDNWYLYAWCHLRDDMRSFSIDAIRQATMLDAKAKEVAQGTVQEALESGYGIFSGTATTWAQLKFSPARAPWVITEQWHPQQKGSLQEDGSYLLAIPYTDDRELLMDILKYGAEVEVLAPEALRERVLAEINAMTRRYHR